MTSTNTNTTIDNDEAAAAAAIVRAATVGSGLRHAVKVLILKEQADTLRSILRRLDSDEDGKGWETVRREPSVLIAMLLQEHSRRLEEELQFLGEKEEKKE